MVSDREPEAVREREWQVVMEGEGSVMEKDDCRYEVW